MSNKPTRRSRSALKTTSIDSIWTTIASYANELAPVAGPLLDAIGQTADAIDRAERQHRSIEVEWEEAKTH